MKYRTIVADPPWDYGSDHARWPSDLGGSISRRSIPYSPMSVGEIEALPIFDLADSHCRLFLWATNRFLPDAFRVLKAWDFAYRQTLVWRKTGSPSPFGGSVAPNTSEFLLVATHGAPPVANRLRASVIDAAKQHAHSRKPEVFQDLIETVSPGPYLELFARRQRLGWDSWGNECRQDVSLEVVA